MTREQLDLEERNSFLEWRRKLAQYVAALLSGVCSPPPS